MRKIIELRYLFKVLESTDGSWTNEQKIEEIKRARYNKLITNDEAIDLAIEYSTEWQAADLLKEQIKNSR